MYGRARACEVKKICRKEQEADAAANQSEARAACRYSRDETSLFYQTEM